MPKTEQYSKVIKSISPTAAVSNWINTSKGYTGLIDTHPDTLNIAESKSNKKILLKPR